MLFSLYFIVILDNKLLFLQVSTKPLISSTYLFLFHRPGNYIRLLVQLAVVPRKSGEKFFPEPIGPMATYYRVPDSGRSLGRSSPCLEAQLEALLIFDALKKEPILFTKKYLYFPQESVYNLYWCLLSYVHCLPIQRRKQ